MKYYLLDMDEFKTLNLFDFSNTAAELLLRECEYPWEALCKIADFILEYGNSLSKSEYDHPADDIWISKTASVAESAHIMGPCIIGPCTEVRHSAFIRGKALIGTGCVIGNSVEVKNSILFDKAKAPHFNYVGDSILGFKAHMGAGSITSNVKSDESLVAVRYKDKKIETGLKKFGAILGDNVEIGCNSVLNPGTVIGKNSTVYPLSCVRGFIPEDLIYKDKNNIVHKITG